MQFRDLKKQYQVLKKPMDEAISKVLEASNYISGSQVAELEEKLAAYVGVKHWHYLRQWNGCADPGPHDLGHRGRGCSLRAGLYLFLFRRDRCL